MVTGYIVYGVDGYSDGGELVNGIIDSNKYRIKSTKIEDVNLGVEFHEVNSGDNLDGNGLYDPLDFGLEKSGYQFIGWQNIDETGKVHGLYDHSTIYDVDGFVTQKGKLLKEDVKGSYIYMRPYWKNVNSPPVIGGADIYILVTSNYTKERLARSVTVMDNEDGDISDKIKFKNFHEIGLEIEGLKGLNQQDDRIHTFSLLVEVEDSHGELVEAEVDLFVVCPGNLGGSYRYVRFISKDYIDTFESDSIWNTTQYQEVLNSLH